MISHPMHLDSLELILNPSISLNGILPLPAVLSRRLQKPALVFQILLKPAFGH
jgi:hypothetical protein